MDQAICRSVPEAGVPYLEAGEGETLLLLHGSTGHSGVWRNAIAAMQSLFRVVAPDLIGYGKSSPWMEDKPLSLMDEAARLRGLLPCCGKPFHLVGHSYGGAVALQMALDEPARIRSLTLIEPVFFSTLRYAGDEHAYAAFAGIRDEFASLLAAGRPQTAMKRFIGFWNGARAWEKLPSESREQLVGMTEKVLQDWRGSFAADPGAEVLQKLRGKTLLLRGDRSPEPMRILVDRLASQIPASQCEVISGAGHLLPSTHSEAVIGRIMDHLHRQSERRLR